MDIFIEQFGNYSIPSFLHYGCKKTRQHNFTEVQTIYGEDGSRVFSGGLVYDWLELAERPEDMGM
jgi:hypothetical protein